MVDFPRLVSELYWPIKEFGGIDHVCWTRYTCPVDISCETNLRTSNASKQKSSGFSLSLSVSLSLALFLSAAVAKGW